MQEIRFKFLFTMIWYCFSILYFSFHGPGGKVKLRLRAVSRHWPLLLNNLIRDSWQHLAGGFTTFLKIHFGEKIALVGYLYLLSNVSWLFKRIKSGIVNNSSRGQWTKENEENQGSRSVLHPFLTRTLYQEALSGDAHQRHTHLMSQWTLSWEWTNSSLFCWLPLFDLCCWPLFGDSLLSFNIANCRLLFALLFH